MFTLSDIAQAHASVKTGADFPRYAGTLRAMGVVSYDAFVSDGHCVYFGNPEPLTSPSKYDTLEIGESSHTEKFIERLRIHQNGGSDYMTFCRDCAENGVEKWTINMEAGTCTYFDRKGDALIIEHFPLD